MCSKGPLGNSKSYKPGSSPWGTPCKFRNGRRSPWRPTSHVASIRAHPLLGLNTSAQPILRPPWTRAVLFSRLCPIEPIEGTRLVGRHDWRRAGKGVIRAELRLGSRLCSVISSFRGINSTDLAPRPDPRSLGFISIGVPADSRWTCESAALSWR